MTPEQFEFMKAFNAEVAERKKEKQKEQASKRAKKWRLANPDKAHEAVKKWYLKNHEKAKEKKRLYAKEWNRKNKDIIKEKNATNYRANIEKNRADSKIRRYKNRYGITVEERDAMIAKQGGCACCGTTSPNNKYGWQVDHCHRTNIIRGMLCHDCNIGLGCAKDSIEILEKMIAYLEKHNDSNQLTLLHRLLQSL